jgi:hypothetical protein
MDGEGRTSVEYSKTKATLLWLKIIKAGFLSLYIN